MALIALANYNDLELLSAQLAGGLRAASSLEGGAQWFAEQMAARFPSVVLARVFATLEFAQLPAPERDAARAAARENVLVPETDVLTLLGSAGRQPEWNDRRRSRQHRAIPLLGREQVEGIPMVSRLLRDLRYHHKPEPSEPTRLVTRAVANANGLFFVPHAATTVDERGRRVIPAAEFVAAHRVASVFGFGGAYLSQATFVATILFTTEVLRQENAMHFLRLSSAFKAATTRLVSRGLFFEPDAADTGCAAS